MARLKDKAGGFGDRVGRQLENATTASVRRTRPHQEVSIPGPPGRAAGEPLEDRLTVIQGEGTSSEPAPTVAEPQAVEPAARHAEGTLALSEHDELTDSDSRDYVAGPTGTGQETINGLVVEATPDRARESQPTARRTTTRAKGSSSTATTHRSTSQPTPAYELAGFVGVIAEDGFPLPRAGEDGQLQKSGETLRNTNLRVSHQLRRALHKVQLWEQERTGRLSELERLHDAALLLLPDDLDGIERFVAAVPDDLRRAPDQPVTIGTRLRARQFDRLALLRARFGAEGRQPIKLAEVHRAVIWHYTQRYEHRRAEGLI